VPQLDGLRAAAVLAVMLEHSGIAIGRGGLFGVDVFFVLSGFLITGVLLGEHRARGRISLRRFYVRRWLRLYPALVVMVIVLMPIGPSLSADHTWASWLRAVAAALTYTGNFVVLADGRLTLGVLDPTWSLAVEEQFYLLWPLALLALMAWRVPARWIVGILVTASAAGLSLFWLLYHRPEHALAPFSIEGRTVYVRPDARFGELLLGCALAIVLARRDRPLSRRANAGIGVAALAAVGGLWVARELFASAYDGNGSPIAPVPLVAVCATVLLARLVTSDRALLSRLLRCSPLPQIGLISYSLYLWHSPVFNVIHADPFGLVGAEQVVQWTLAFAVAFLSYRLVELPFLRRKERLRTTPVAGLDAAPEAAPIAQPEVATARA
jgi:peptidoglycan/LPS O-acetylase OafA/YrhL